MGGGERREPRRLFKQRRLQDRPFKPSFRVGAGATPWGSSPYLHRRAQHLQHGHRASRSVTTGRRTIRMGTGRGRARGNRRTADRACGNVATGSLFEVSPDHPPGKATPSYSGTATLSTLAPAAVALAKGRAGRRLGSLGGAPVAEYLRCRLVSAFLPVVLRCATSITSFPTRSRLSVFSPSSILTLLRYSTRCLSIITFSLKLISKVYVLMKMVILPT
jgi:hypothetical protein